MAPGGRAPSLSGGRLPCCMKETLLVGYMRAVLLAGCMRGVGGGGKG